MTAVKKNKIRDIDIAAPRELEVTPSAPVNEYYIDIANKFKTAKFICVIILVVFILIMISVFRSDITLENCKYLVRFFSSANTVYSGDYDNIYYDTSGVVSTNMFNEDFVTVKNDSIELYDLRGSNIASYDINQTTPTVVTNGKYMLVYDQGANSFSLFNNFSLLTTESYDYPISLGTVSPEGMYAIVTKSLDYQSVIYLYDHNFNLISKIYKDKYITDLKIDSDGDRLLCTSVYAENGSYVSEVMTYAPYTEAEESTQKVNDSFFASCGFFANGGYGVLSDRALLFYNSSNKEVGSFQLGNIVPTDCLFLDDRAVLCYNENIVGSQSRVMIFNTSGELIGESTVDDKIIGTAYDLDHLYLLTDSRVARINLESFEKLSADVEKSAVSIFAPGSGNLVIGYSNMAKAYKVGDLFDPYAEENK